MIDKKHAVQSIALTETMTLSLFSLIISYLLALSSHFLTFCRQQCGGNQKSPSYQSEVHDNGCHASCLGYFLASVKMLHCVTRCLACHPSYELLSPTAPSKEAVKCLTSYFFFKNVMTSSKFQKFVQTRNSNIRDQRYRYHCCVPGSCLGGSDISQVSPHMGWIKSWGINFEKPKSTPHSTRGAWNGARFHWIESEWHTWGQWNLMQAENPICALKGLEMASHIWGQWNTLPSF